MIVEMYMQYWIASAVLVAANLGIADLVDDTARNVEEIGRAVGADEECLFRLMRGLASAGVFREVRPRYFVGTPLSKSLRSECPGNARGLIRAFGLKSTREAMVEYETAIRTGRSAFELVHGKASPFDVMAQRPEETSIYNGAMSSDLRLMRAVRERGSFAEVRKLVDVGGGRGVLLASILKGNPGQFGVLFDLPDVVADNVLAEYGVAERCDVLGGDMRAEMPEGGDGYILKNIAHGCSDDDCVALLDRIGERAAPHARVFIIENVMPDGNGEAPCKLFDLFLLLGGRESKVRSEREFRELLERSDMALSRVIPLAANQCIVEARCV